MTKVHHLASEIGVLGWSCRLPGAKDVASFWSLLKEGRCAVTEIPEDRWAKKRFGHPQRQLRGKSYTWAAGVVDGVWDFDPAVFGISPREAEQLDPQQRLLLELTWEALEDAGIKPSSIAGTEVGVFVGGSSTDYANFRTGDPACADSHFATGNALSVLANRISYIFDLKGPSLTIDTACSSSLVALHHASEALRSRRIDTAIVAGVNVLASPFSFISFSQASMLSPTGRSRAFSADADGYVRAEGGVVLVLKRASSAELADLGAHGLIVASDVNSDGRTNGIALPSPIAQERLIRRVYANSGVSPDQLAFVEAHGTGTAAGDPIEASAIGAALGRQRRAPLPIGSVKTNIGHLEPAAGLAGLMKALLALKHGELPRSLHYSQPNPKIAFGDLNIEVAAKPLDIKNGVRGRYAGVNSFGFGGTNAHAIVAPIAKPAGSGIKKPVKAVAPLLLSAKSPQALSALADRYAAALVDGSDAEADRIARATAHRRERLPHRLVVNAKTARDMATALAAFGRGNKAQNVFSGSAPDQPLPIAFVYSGNGSQWVGMGRQAYRTSEEFRTSFDKVDGYFRKLAGWSLAECMEAEDLATRLPQTSVAQPLIFAIQVAATKALARAGLKPMAVLGHSVGEVAAAFAAGALDLETAVRVIYFRSLRQELAADTGDMVVLGTSAETAAEVAEGIAGLEIAAHNSARAVTLSGPKDALDELTRRAGQRSISVIPLSLGYPFHNALMEPSHAPLLEDLRSIKPSTESIPFVSTVTGNTISGPQLNATYWWRNVREPVLFSDAVKIAADLGARYFLEVGPRGTLQRHVKTCLEGRDGPYVSAITFDGRKEERAEDDPIANIIAQALVAGAQVNEEVVFGPDERGAIDLPHYAWDRRSYRFEPTGEAVGYRVSPWHPLCGDRHVAGGLEWRSILDTTIAPELADHEVAGQPILPGAAFLEMALAAARQWLEATHVVIRELEIQKPLNLSSSEPREIMTRISPGSSTFEISSRPRLTGAAWLVHARGKIFAGTPAHEVAPAAPVAKPVSAMSGDELYALARACGLNYGPAFRLVTDVTRVRTDEIELQLAPNKGDPAFLLDPMLLDACFHGLFVLFPELDTTGRGVAYIPVRIEETAFHAVGAKPARARIKVRRIGPRSILADFTVLGDDGDVIATLLGARFVAVQARRRPMLENIAVVEQLRAQTADAAGEAAARTNPADVVARLESERENEPEGGDSSMMLEGWATAAGYEIASGLAESGAIDVENLILSGRVPVELKTWLGTVFAGLKQAGLIEGGPDKWCLVPDPLLPSSADVVGELAASHPSRAPELLLAGSFSVLAANVAKMRKITDAALERISQASLDFFAVAGQETGHASERLQKLADAVLAEGDQQRAQRVLVVGTGKLAERWRARADHDKLAVSILETDPAAPDRNKTQGAPVEVFTSTEQLPAGRFDLALSVGDLSQMDEGGLAALRRALLPGGLLLAAEPPPSLFRDLVFGLTEARAQSTKAHPATLLRTAARWSGLVRTAGFEATATTALGAHGAGWLLIAARAPDQAAAQASVREASAAAAAAKDAATPPARLVIAEPGGSTPMAEALARKIGAKMATAEAVADMLPEQRREIVIVLNQTKTGDRPSDIVGKRSLFLGALAGRLNASGTATRIWIVHHDALAASHDDGRTDPVGAASWTFCRTLANEHTFLDLRRIDIVRRVPAAAAVERIAALLASDTAETELQIDRDVVRVVRVEAFAPAASATVANAPAARLTRGNTPGQRLVWQAVERPTPGPGEVEIAVEATGLNFRDLMWSMDLLPDDMLEDGFTGPALGLECAGTITRIGPGVTRASVGDRVVAMASQAFSTHVVTNEQMLAKIPDHMPAEAAATIPVAFLTAYYSLVTLAKLEQGESVLIHGAAGAVGLAAIQIARERGAKIIATAGSKAKRDLLRAMGIEHVLDSRTTAFAEDVRQITGEGVDVVLNSLAGEPMERSVHALRPFGRFVELGKRDYVANTHLGLRPFRKNLSYFGVDVDQLIAGRRDAGQRVFTNVMRLMREQTLTPLPYSVFEGSNVVDAFQLMQHSGHVGKIVVRPPALSTIPASLAPVSIDPKRTHLITGAFGGFGVETARWLVARGARNLVLLGRHGAATPEARALVSELEAKGVKVMAAQCDIANAKAAEDLFKTVKATMPPLAGVIHAAMVLDDGLIANLDIDRLARVLEPKVTGAANLDRLTRGEALDYFVMFSSITTVIGNPGQASYVAANGYLEGLARRRRQDGLPGLAIAWGPISDVGVVARDEKLKKALMDRRGLSGMGVAEALDLFGDALARASQDPELAVITIAPRDWTKQVNVLAALRSPTYSAIVRSEVTVSDQEEESIDLRGLLQTEEPDVARRKVVAMVAKRLGAVLHMRAEDIDQSRPFSEMGVDSLMTFELASSLEKAFEMPIALSGGLATLCISDLADQLMAQAGRDRTQGSIATAIVEKHMSTATPETVAVLSEVAASKDLRHKRLTK